MNPQPLSLLRVPFLLALLLASLASPLFSYEQEVRNAAKALVEGVSGQEIHALAVVDFTDLDGNATQLGRFLAEELSVALSGAGSSFKVIDRTHLKTLIQESKLSSAGLIDPKTARELGRIAGAQALVTGTITPLGDEVRLTVKVLSTDTALLLYSTAFSIPRTQAIDELLRRGLHVTSASGPVSVPGAPQSEQTSQAGALTVALQGCKVSEGSLTCELLLTAQEDLAVTFRSEGSRAIDDSGNEYAAAAVKLGSVIGSYWPRSQLIANVPVKAGVLFIELRGGIRMLRVLQLNFAELGSVVFRDVSVPQ